MPVPKGTIVGGGSRKGRPNKVTAELKEMVLQALDKAGGVAYLVRQAEENPRAFLGLIGRVLPLTVYGDVNVTHRSYVVTVPEITESEQWESQYRPATPALGAPSSVPKPH